MTCTYIGPPSGPDPVAGPAYELGYDNGYEAGRDEMARAFWAAVCEQLAREADDESASLKSDSGSYPQMSQWTRDWYRAESKVKAAQAAQLRAWAGEP